MWDQKVASLVVNDWQWCIFSGIHCWNMWSSHATGDFQPHLYSPQSLLSSVCFSMSKGCFHTLNWSRQCTVTKFSLSKISHNEYPWIHCTWQPTCNKRKDLTYCTLQRIYTYCIQSKSFRSEHKRRTNLQTALVHSTITDITLNNFLTFKLLLHTEYAMSWWFLFSAWQLEVPPLLGRKEKRLIILSSCFTDLRICYGHHSKSTRHFDFDFESSIPVNVRSHETTTIFFLLDSGQNLTLRQ